MTLYTADTSSKFPHENSATVSKDIDYLIVHKITGLSMSLPKNLPVYCEKNDHGLEHVKTNLRFFGLTMSFYSN